MTMQGMGRISSMLGRAAREPLPTAGRRRGRQWSPRADPDLDDAAEGFAAPWQMAQWGWRRAGAQHGDGGGGTKIGQPFEGGVN